MKWFDDVFLKSLFNQTGANRDKWITAKQTAICIKYMQRNTAHIETASGTYKHDNYYYQWENRQVFLSYSKLNGCSTINFSLTPEEIAADNEKYRLEKLRAKKELYKMRWVKHPERHNANIEKLKAKIEDYQTEINECKAENDLNGIENLEKYVEEMKADLKMMIDAVIEA